MLFFEYNPSVFYRSFMNSSRVNLLPANFAFCTLILPFLTFAATAMQTKNGFITAQKPSFSVPNINSRRLRFDNVFFKA